MKNRFIKTKLGAVVAAVLGTAASFSAAAQTAGSDPTTGIVTTLGTYATDVGLLAAAVLLIFYGKKLVTYLRV